MSPRPRESDSAVRGVARYALELAGTASGLSALARRISVRRASVIAYHNVVEPDDAGRGDSSLHLPLSKFLKQIDWLAETHQVVALDTAAAGGVGSRPQAVITFDDAYRGAVSLALPEVVRRGLPATVFVSPALLGAGSTWWDEMGEAGLLAPELRRACLHELGGRTEAIRENMFREKDVPILPRSYGIAAPDELREHCREGITLASHAWAHEHLPSMDRADREASLRRTLEWLDTFGGPTTSWLALPYGAESPATIGSALDLGHAGVLRITGGRWGEDRDRTAVPRINVPAGLSLRGLELRTSGLMT